MDSAEEYARSWIIREEIELQALPECVNKFDP